MQLSASKQTLAGLLGGMGYQLVIPPYQRPYAWGREQVDDLWDDVVGAIGQGHFMGSLVLNAENEQKPQVIDCKQRLTTLLLLIRLIQEEFLARGAQDRAEPLYMLLFANPFAEGDDKYRLRTGDANWSVFRDYVLRRHDDPLRKTWDLAVKESKAVRTRNEPLFENARVLTEKLTSWLDGLEPPQATDALVRLQETLISRLEFVQVSVGSAPDAFLLFETLNDRGLQLSQGDLLKNHLLSRIAASSADSSAQVQQAADEWDGLVDDLGSADVTKFLRHYLQASSFPVKKEQVFDRFKAQVAAAGPVPLLAELRSYGRLYGQFLDPSKVDGDTEIQSQLRALLVLRAESCYPALLMARRFLPRDDFLAFARLAEILTYRYSSVCGLAANELQAGYYRAANILLSSGGARLSEARAEIETMLPGSAQFIASFCRQRMGAQYLVRYTLQNIERAVNPGKEFKANDAVHIEHVMPQTLSAEWLIALGDDVLEHPVFVQRWGNLALLHAPLNIGASNSLFINKQLAYTDSQVTITSDLRRYLRWGLDVIERRQEWLAAVADAVWSVDGFKSADVPPGPMQLHSALDGLTEAERASLEHHLTSEPAETPGDLSAAVAAHAAEVANQPETAGVAQSLSQVLNLWDLLGADGRRLATAAAAYFVSNSDAVDDHLAGGLLDDLNVVNRACEALAVQVLTTDD